ncbi:ATP-binding domain-containing protein, partial [Marinobacter lutaoensis]|uniref:ATP-binding domain-containing protein n=1 Tax=Marinobacter lutaoensis TaxID=135739 RepID=UPI001593B669
RWVAALLRSGWQASRGMGGNLQRFTQFNSETAIVKNIEGGIVTFTLANGKVEKFDMSQLKNSHWDHGYAMTVNAAQGKTAENVFVHAETNRTALLNTEQFYVQLSRAKNGVYLYTDSREGLIKAVEQRTGQKQAAKESRFQPLAPLDHLMDKLWGRDKPQQEQQNQREAAHRQNQDRGGMALSR